MSEKRFYELASSIDYYQIWDKQEDKGYTIGDAVDKLNEQQVTIEQLQKKLSECQGHKLELTPIPISRAITLKEAEDSIRVTKYEELFDDE